MPHETCAADLGPVRTGQPVTQRSKMKQGSCFRKHNRIPLQGQYIAESRVPLTGSDVVHYVRSRKCPCRSTKPDAKKKYSTRKRQEYRQRSGHAFRVSHRFRAHSPLYCQTDLVAFIIFIRFGAQVRLCPTLPKPKS